MAGLSDDSGRSRGQLLLVGAFGVAVLLLVLAGVLNTVTYTESLATREGDVHDGRDIEAFQADTRAAVGGIVDRVNADNGTAAEKTVRVERSVGNWSTAAGREQALDTTAATATVVNATATSTGQQDPSRPFTNASGEPKWTLATSVTETRAFTVNVTQSSLVTGNCTGSGSCYTLVVDNGSATWTVAVNRTTVVVDGPSASGTCPITSDPVRINVTDGTVNGDPCSPLTFAEGVASPYELRYRNGNNATGTYELTVEGAPVEGNYGDNPSLSATVRDVTVRVSYRTPQLAYRTEIVVSGGEE